MLVAGDVGVEVEGFGYWTLDIDDSLPVWGSFIVIK
jgi:hypothetical protein